MTKARDFSGDRCVAPFGIEIPVNYAVLMTIAACGPNRPVRSTSSELAPITNCTRFSAPRLASTTTVVPSGLRKPA
ncbi:MAG: hypothetical protein WDO73_16725 [Ignavibacteriota bacterium]